jgi:hypothetical protein
VIQCLCLLSKVLEVIRADLPQTRQDEIHEFTEQECGHIVRICDIKISYAVFGYMEAAYRFWGRLQDGHGGQGDISRRLQARTARISIRYHPPRN